MAKKSKQAGEASFEDLLNRVALEVQRHWDFWQLPIGYRFVIPLVVRDLPKNERTNFLVYLQQSDRIFVATAEKTNAKYIFPALARNAISHDDILRKLRELKMGENTRRRMNAAMKKQAAG